MIEPSSEGRQKRIFRTQSNIHDGAFLKIVQAVNCFRKNATSGMPAGF